MEHFVSTAEPIDDGAVLEDYRVEIVELEARARATREGWFSTDFEVNQREAEELDGAARSLRLALAQIMRTCAREDAFLVSSTH